MEEHQYHIYGTRLCGRAVRMRELSACEVEENACVAVGLMQPTDNMMRLQHLEYREGIKRALVAVSKKAHLTPEQVAKLRESDWEPMTLTKLKMPGEWNYEELFGPARDHNAMVRIWKDLHTPIGSELDAIVEKRCPVATEDAVRSIGSATGTAG